MDPNIAELLGIDLSDPDVQQENAAIDRDMRLIEQLVQLRKSQGLTQAQVAERMERSQPVVSDFERLGGDPHLSTIRRYALAIGATVHHIVRPTLRAEPQTRANPPMVRVTSAIESMIAADLCTATSSNGSAGLVRMNV
ncbi:helix-turn-helix transcriptional regulator [Sphaerisporangium sp. TRM90804]|uniref:helix-turn-helix domain-containing protein n=1 Tax=Sphaerisporangium sp. TRM90804 TaxID=3031113 RepID=UPI002447C9E2|nr:helix-turn-helix transcriptional regulator [Sphaerisporangium sp. TRM90804]MDH2425800.1 helix-turn-helix domain-containing protein [Sphaerisporangium sp. TRM90804]